jgi:hypothetical protein
MERHPILSLLLLSSQCATAKYRREPWEHPEFAVVRCALYWCNIRLWKDNEGKQVYGGRHGDERCDEAFRAAI